MKIYFILSNFLRVKLRQKALLFFSDKKEERIDMDESCGTTGVGSGGIEGGDSGMGSAGISEMRGSETPGEMKLFIT